MRKTRKYVGFGWLVETFGDGEIAVPETEVTIESDARVLYEHTDGYEEARSALEEMEAINDEMEVHRIKSVEGVFMSIKIDGEWAPWVFGEDELYAIERLEDEYGDY